MYYICIFIIVLVILDIIYVSYSFQKQKFAVLWPLQALRQVVGLFVTILFLPFIETFTSVISCLESEDGRQVHGFFPELECWTGAHILHASFAVAVSSTFIVISTVVAYTYYDCSNLSNDPTARINARADTTVLISKIILNYLFNFFATPDDQWICIFVLNVLSFIMFFRYKYEWPYFT